jgi:hypothetical protein
MNEAPVQRTKLDDLADKLHAALRSETKNIIALGKILIESKDELKHGHWKDWLEKNFDLSYRTAINYISATRYVELNSATVAHFENLAPSVLYALADGRYSDDEEAAILAATREGRVDTGRVNEILAALDEATDDDKDDQDGSSDDDDQDGSSDAENANDAADDQDGSSNDDDDANTEDAETKAILDGAPAAVPPPPPIKPPPDFALLEFDEAVDTLNDLKTKSAAHFAKTVHSADDLKTVEDFLHAVADQARRTVGKA